MQIFDVLPVEIRVKILSYIDTASQMALSKVDAAMATCVPLSINFRNFYASEMYSIEDEDYNVIASSGHVIDTFVLQGNDTWLMTLGKTFSDFMRPMTNLTTLVLSRTCVPTTLYFLPQMPKTLVRLQLDNLAFPATEFIHCLRPLSDQLDELAITSNSQLTCYDLVTILQWYWKLDKLDIRHSEYLRPATVGTILRYCYNLQVFFFTTMFKCSDSRAWVDLAECNYEYITFDDDFYEQLNSHKMFIDMGIDDPSYDSD